jgi:hypothetical protein
MKLASAVAVACSIAAACGGTVQSPSVSEESALSPERNSQLVHIPLFIRNAAGQIPSDPAELIFESSAGQPVLAPDGHQLTLAEFSTPKGRASVKCVESGTHAVLNLSGLIPHGVYSVFVLVFKSPGFDGTFTNLIGLGSIGAAGGSANSFVADGSGAASVSAITPGGPLSMAGSIASCAPTGEFEFHLVAAYHIDGQTHGATPGPAGTFVKQFAFIFRG